MVLYKTLKQANKKYDKSMIERLSILYKGGYKVRDHAEMFLPQLAAETDPSYQDRLKACSYIPFMSDIINHFAAMLFAQELSIADNADSSDPKTIGKPLLKPGIYQKFVACANLRGDSLEEVGRKIFIDALTHKRSFIGVDYPSMDDEPINQLEEELLGTGQPYLYHIDQTCVLDWSFDESGKLKWIKLSDDVDIQESPLDKLRHQEQFKIWTMQDGVAVWECYHTAVLDLGKYPGMKDEIPLVGSGETSFDEIPIHCLNLPHGLDLGCVIGPICEDIFQRTSILVNGENKSLNAMRVVFLGEEMTAPGQGLPSAKQMDPYRAAMLNKDWEARGFAELGGNDRIEVIESQGHAFAVCADQIYKLVESLKEAVHQMANSAASHTKALSRSASSKQQDRHSEEIVLTAYGNIMRDFFKQLMSCVSRSRKEDIVWVISGLDNFNVVDRDQLIMEMQQFTPFLASNQDKSPTFTKLYTERTFLAMLDGASHEECLQIRQEIRDAIDKQGDKAFKLPEKPNDPNISLPKKPDDESAV